MSKVQRRAEEEYQAISSSYFKATKRPLRKFAYEPTILNYLKSQEIKGARVLDLACGEGVSSRLLKKLGARYVLGIDISKDLIKIAQSGKQEGIRYLVGDVFSKDFSRYGQFDVVTAIMLIHYANNELEIKRLLRNVAKCLKKQGLFYLLTVNPSVMKKGYKNYGVKITKEKKSLSTLIELHDFNWSKYCEFHINYYSKKIYNRIFKEAGFSIEWLPGIVSKRGIGKYGEEFWSDYKKESMYSIIRAVKNN